MVIKERFLTGAIAGEKKRVIPRIVQPEREHSGQPIETRRSPLAIRLKQNLGVATGSEPMATGFQLGAELAIIVNLAVEIDLQLPGGVAHGLMPAGGEIDYRKAAVRQPDSSIRRPPLPRVIGTAMTHGISLRDEKRAVANRCNGSNSNDSAHYRCPVVSIA
jgi:hypothetical protein